MSAPRSSSAVALIGCATPSGGRCYSCRDRFADAIGTVPETPGSRPGGRLQDFSSMPMLNRLISQRFQAERESIAQDARLQRQGRGRRKPGRRPRSRRWPGTRGRPLPVQDDRTAESPGPGCAPAAQPPMMHVSAIRSTPSTARGSRCRLTIDSRAVAADRAGLAELQLDGRAEPDHVAVAERPGLDGLAVDERGWWAWRRSRRRRGPGWRGSATGRP